MNWRQSISAGVFAALLGATGAQAEPLKVAVVETLSGPQASTGLLFRTAIKYELDKLNAQGGFRGERVEFQEYDNQGGPVGAADRVRAAIAGGARVIFQGSSTAVATQITEDVRKYNLRNPGKEVLFINVGAEGMELTGEKCHFYHVRLGPNTSMRFNLLIKAMAQSGDLGKRVYTINQSYSPGFTTQKVVEDNAAKLGYEIVGKVYHEVNKIQDFSPYVAQIQQARPDTILTNNWSNDLLLLMKAAGDAKLKARFATAFLDQPGNIANIGEVAEGHYQASPFNAQTNEAADKLAEEYKAATGHYPAYVETNGMLGTQVFAAALKSLNQGKGPVGAKEIVLALEGTKITTPMGEMSVRKEDHQVMMPLVLHKVSKEAKIKVDGTQYGFVPVATFTAEQIGDPLQDSCKMQRP